MQVPAQAVISVYQVLDQATLGIMTVSAAEMPRSVVAPSKAGLKENQLEFRRNS